MEKPSYQPEEIYSKEYIQALVDLYTYLGYEYQGLSPKQLEQGLMNVDPQLIDEIQLSEEWIKKHKSK